MVDKWEKKKRKSPKWVERRLVRSGVVGVGGRKSEPGAAPCALCVSLSRARIKLSSSVG